MGYPMKKKFYQSLCCIIILLTVISAIALFTGCSVTHAEEVTEQTEQTEQIEETPQKETFWQYLERNKVVIFAQLGTILDVILGILLLVLRKTNKNSVLGLAKSENNFRNSLKELQGYMAQVNDAKQASDMCQEKMQELKQELLEKQDQLKKNEEQLLSTVQGIAAILEVFGKGLNIAPEYQVTVHKLWDKITNTDLNALKNKETLDKVGNLLKQTQTAIIEIKDNIKAEALPAEPKKELEQPKKIAWEG